MHVKNTAVGLLLTAFYLSAGCIACAGEPGIPTAPETIWPTQSWPVSTPEEQGMDSAGLARLVETVGGSRQDSLTYPARKDRR